MMPANDDTLHAPVIELIRNHLKLHRRTLPVSVSRVSRFARQKMPELTLSDRALSELIGTEAISAGHSVHFDSKNPWPRFYLDLPV